MNNNRIAIVVPCYNEEKRLEFSEFEAFIKDNIDYDFIFINDGSKDGTLQKLTSFSESFQNRVFVINNERNLGKSNSIREGFILAQRGNYGIIGFLDADLATPLYEAKRLVNSLHNESDILVALGSRVHKLLGSNILRSKKRFISSRILAYFFAQFTRLKAYDTQCGAKFFRKEICPIVFEQKFKTRWLFDLEILLRIKQNNYDVNKYCREYPLYLWRDIGDSKLSFFDFYKIFNELFRIYKIYVK